MKKITILIILISSAFLYASNPNEPSITGVQNLRDEIKELKKIVASQQKIIEQLKDENVRLKKLCNRAGIKIDDNRQIVRQSRLQKSKNFPIGSPERALVEFMWAWKLSDWKKLYSLTAYRHGLYSYEDLIYEFQKKELLNFQLLKTKYYSRGLREAGVLIEYKESSGQINKKHASIRIEHPDNAPNYIWLIRTDWVEKGQKDYPWLFDEKSTQSEPNYNK